MSIEWNRFHKRTKESSDNSGSKRSQDKNAAPAPKEQRAIRTGTEDRTDRYERLLKSNFLNEDWLKAENKRLRTELVERSGTMVVFEPRAIARRRVSRARRRKTEL